MTKKSNKIILDAYIQNGVIQYYDTDYKKKWDEFKVHNDNQRISLTLENADKPEHYLYKYYWGFLLPDLTFHFGEKNTARIHLIMKRQFLMINATTFDEIPKKYFKKGVFRVTYDDIMNLENGDLDTFVGHIKGIIIIEHEGELFGYIASNSDISHQEMQDYITKVEHHLFVDLQGRIGEEGRDPKEAKKLRDKGFQQTDLEKTFSGEDVTGIEKPHNEKSSDVW